MSAVKEAIRAKKRTQLAFLRVKGQLVENECQPSVRSYPAIVDWLETILDQFPLKSLALADRELEQQLIIFGPQGAPQRVHAELARQFGYCSLGRLPLDIIAEVKKSGRVKSELQAEVVDSFIKGDYGAGPELDEMRLKLSDILGRYEMRRIQKR